MTRIWYCRNCGYEVHSRGRCHNCREKLSPSALPELESGPDDEEVGYRIDGWSERDRGRLIERLNDLGIVHRFEEEELIVDASDEDRVDDLVAVLAEGFTVTSEEEDEGRVARDDSALDDLDGSGVEATEGGSEGVPLAATAEERVTAAAVALLADAAGRLKRDPTDMQADADVAEASAAVFLPERFGPLDADAWSAVGRATRRLLSLLGADEALEEGIRREAAILEKLLAPVSEPPAAESSAEPALDSVPGEKTVYELPDWHAEQRAHLGVLLEDAGILYAWEGGDLVVPADREADVESMFDQVSGDTEDDDESDETRYQAVAELFAACGRLAGDPKDPQRREAVLEWAREAAGPPLLGMDEVDWFRISSHTRTLVTSIEEDQDADLIAREADTLHDMLRAVV